MTIPSSLLGGLTPEEFLAEYWQKKPLLVRGALPGFRSPITPEELAGLALDEETEARLILERGGDYPWQLRHGPFEENDFAALPETHWTLLVQEVDRLVPEVRHLLDHFRFIPSWRIDDVMVSFAPEKGGVGAHVDSYDVFLLQGLGRRRWQIGYEPVYEEELVPDIDIRILADFEPDDEWVLEPGDMLYLPPRIPHYGVAEDACMTYSIGFRAPSHEEILSGFLTRVLEQIDPLARYADPDLRPQENPGEIRPEAIEKVRQVVRELVRPEEVDRWFGAFMTEPKRGYYALPLDVPYTADEVVEALQSGARLEHHPAARFAYVRHEDGETSLFVGGEEYLLEPELADVAPLVCAERVLDAELLGATLERREAAALLTDLVNEGFLLLSDDH